MIRTRTGEGRARAVARGAGREDPPPAEAHPAPAGLAGRWRLPGVDRDIAPKSSAARSVRPRRRVPANRHPRDTRQHGPNIRAVRRSRRRGDQEWRGADHGGRERRMAAVGRRPVSGGMTRRWIPPRRPGPLPEILLAEADEILSSWLTRSATLYRVRTRYGMPFGGEVLVSACSFMASVASR